MTIELITGAPGAGKTTFAVAERIAKEAERELDLEINGQPRRVKRRVLVAGIGGLLVEHERIPHTLTGDPVSERVIDYWNQTDGDGEPVFKRLRGEPPLDVPGEVNVNGKLLPGGPSLFNWWMWCQPGDLIVVDEVQFIVPRGTLGRKPPLYIALLEVHRHYGVDFLFITQHPQLLDTTIRNLVGMHRHVRPVLGFPVCMVYTWDHAANPERYNLASKSKFIRRAEHYRLFKSAAAHVKPPTAGRSVLVIAPLLLAVAVAGGIYFKHKFSPGQAVAAPVAVSAPGRIAPAVPASLPGQAGTRARSVREAYPDVVEVAGCFARDDMCQCYGQDGGLVRVADRMCRVSASSFDGLVPWRKRLPQPEAASQPGRPASGAIPFPLLASQP